MELGAALGRPSVIVLLKFTLLVGVCTACSEPEGWQPMTIVSRASSGEVNYVILGNVTRTTPPRFIRRFGGTVYGAKVAVECVYKKAQQQNIYQEIEVTGFGESNDCTTTDVQENLPYIFLLAPFQSDYAVVEANVQLGAEVATEDNLQAMLSTFGCREPSEPTTPPPTTTPLTTNPPPTTRPPLTTIIPTVVVTEPAAQDLDDGWNGSDRLHLCCFLAVIAMMSSFIFV